MRPVRLAPIVKEATRLLRSSIPATIDMHIEIEEQSGLVMADATQIHQIVMNLCTNAYHAMRDSGGELTVALEQNRLSEEEAKNHVGLRAAPYVVLIVSDTGIGMDKETLDRVFDPYFTTKEIGDGTGLGMAVVHNIVETHGSTITVHSKPGVGTTFRVYFPLVVTSDVKTEEAPDIEKPVGHEFVLFVDDEEANRSVVEKGLSRLGFHVTTVPSALEALDLFQDDTAAFDVVVTDLTMPKMTGIELAQQLRRLAPGIPVILCSGFHNARSAAQAKEVHVDEFLQKPLDTITLGQAIRRALDPGVPADH